MGKREEARLAVVAARRALESAIIALERAERRRCYVEPPALHSIVRFTLRMDKFNGSTKNYNYAAIKADGRWYTTGSTCPKEGYSWQELVEFIGEHALVGELRVITTSLPVERY